MQRSGSTENVGASEWSVRKLATLAIITAITLSIILPLIFPHIAHTSLFYHVILHAASIVIAVFLSVIAVIAYRRVGGTKVLLMSLGFVMLCVFEIFYFIEVTEIVSTFEVPVLNMELPHIIMFIVLMLFAVGISRGRK